MMKNYFISVLCLFFSFSCFDKNIVLQDDLSLKFAKALNLFNKSKFSRAKDEFDYIIKLDPGSKYATESQYYMAESLFQLEEYLEASTVFDRYVRFAPDFSKIEIARYRICECAINSSNSFQRDQYQTQYALEQLQMFIEDFPSSKRLKDAENAITQLRHKLATKDYESARMYLKLEEYGSALIYFKSVLNQFYDISISDDARIGIVFTHILNDNYQGAISYFQSQSGRFLSEEKFNEAEKLLQESEDGLKMSQYIKLYK